jgi:hypothetical protein
MSSGALMVVGVPGGVVGEVHVDARNDGGDVGFGGQLEALEGSLLDCGKKTQGAAAVRITRHSEKSPTYIYF